MCEMSEAAAGRGDAPCHAAGPLRIAAWRRWLAGAAQRARSGVGRLLGDSSGSADKASTADCRKGTTGMQVRACELLAPAAADAASEATKASSPSLLPVLRSAPISMAQATTVATTTEPTCRVMMPTSRDGGFAGQAPSACVRRRHGCRLPAFQRFLLTRTATPTRERTPYLLSDVGGRQLVRRLRGGLRVLAEVPLQYSTVQYSAVQCSAMPGGTTPYGAAWPRMKERRERAASAIRRAKSANSFHALHPPPPPPAAAPTYIPPTGPSILPPTLPHTLLTPTTAPPLTPASPATPGSPAP